MMSLEEINSKCRERFKAYANLQIGGKKIRCPYFINSVPLFFGDLMKRAGVDEKLVADVFGMYNGREIPFGWYRGKGTPEQITEATEQLAKYYEVDLDTTSIEGIIHFMERCGVGVDCSGLVFNLLSFAVDDASFLESLNWPSGAERTVFKAGASAFAGTKSRIVNPSDVRALDLILLRSREGRYRHVALVLEDDGVLLINQSSVSVNPPGLHESRLVMRDRVPTFDIDVMFGKSWKEMYEEGRLEFRRLGCFH